MRENIYKMSKKLLGNPEFCKKLAEKETFDDTYKFCESIQGGYTKEEISSNNWSCNKYTKSKIRIINYYEYSLIVNKFKDISLFKGNYWMSDISNDNGYSLTSSGDVYIYENYNNKLDVRPIITIKK